MKRRSPASVIAWLTVLAAFFAPTVLAEGPAGCLAGKRTVPEDGQSVIIACEAYGQAIGYDPARNRVVPGETYLEGDTLYASAGALVFDVTMTEDGLIRFSGPFGSLAVNDSNDVILTGDGQRDLWRVSPIGDLYFVESDASPGRALEYYPSSGSITTYPKNTYENYQFGFYAVEEPGREDHALSFPEERTAEDGYTLRVFETTDIHGHIADASSGSAESTEYLLAALADRINDARDAYGRENVVLLDGGDLFQGNAISNAVQGQCVIAIFDCMAYDAVSIGNHEFDWGLTTVLDTDATLGSYDVYGCTGDSSIPVVCMNMTRNGEPVEQAVDAVILNKTAVNANGETLPVRVGVIGWADQYASSVIRTEFQDKGYAINADVKRLERKAHELKDAGCDAVIVLAHEDALIMAHQLSLDSGIDLMLGGHSHFIEFGRTMSGIPYLEANCYGKNLGYAEITFSGDGDVRVSTPKVIYTRSEPGKLPDLEENRDDLDAEVLAISREAVLYSLDTLGKTLAILDADLTGAEIDNQLYTSTRSNFALDLIRTGVGAEIAFTNSTGLRDEWLLGESSAGGITAADVYGILPFNNPPHLYEITGLELKELMEFMLFSENVRPLLMSGMDCYWTDGRIVKMELHDGVVIYDDGWADGWDQRHVTIAVNGYVALQTNWPFPEWALEGKETIIDLNENDICIDTLWDLAAGGAYHVDTRPHMIYELSRGGS